MTMRTADSSQDEALLRAIGAVTRNSAMLAQMFQQLAATVTGSQLVVFAFDDKTLMPQRDLLENLLLATNWNPYAPHPPIAERHRQMTLRVLAECRTLIEFRNRIAHDVWQVWPSDEIPDRLEARKPMRWSSFSVETSIRSVNVVAKQFTAAAVALSTMETRIVRSRRDDSLPDQDARPEMFLKSCEERKQGTLDDFLWRKDKWDGRPQRLNRSPDEDGPSEGE